MKKAKIIFKNLIKRKDGYLYYFDGEGNLCISTMGRNKSVSRKHIREIRKRFRELK